MKKLFYVLSAIVAVIAVVAFIGDFEIGGLCTMAAVVPAVTGTGKEGSGVAVTDQVLDTAVSDEVNPDLLEVDIDEMVLKMKPSSTPLDQIMRHAKSQNVKSMEFGYYAVDVRPEKDTVSEKYTAPSAPTTADLRVTLSNNRPELFDVTDTILFPGVKVADGKSLVVRVVAKADDGKLIVMGLNGTPSDEIDGYFLPEIPQGAEMVRMGRAAGELDVQSPMLESLPKKQTNFCQIYKMQIEASKIFIDSKKEVNWNFTDLEENAIYDMRRGMEKSQLFGIKGKIFDTAKKQNIWTTEGIWWQAGKDFQYQEDEFTKESFVDMTKQAFIGNNGSNRRVLIGGSDFISMVSKLMVDKKLNATDIEVKWGITWNLIVTNFGTLYCLHDETFDQVGMPGNGMIIDPEFLTKRVFQPFGKIDLDLVKSGQRNTDARIFTEISGVVLKYPEAHMRIVRAE